MLNEIDVFCLKDLIPTFISCKNGKYTNDALYELQTLANEFGGEYAGKILVTTSGVEGAFKERAKELDIELVNAVERFS